MTSFPLPHSWSPEPGEDTDSFQVRTQENLEALAKAVGDRVTQAGRWTAGAGTLVWPGGSPFSNSLFVSHNLQVPPTRVVATCELPAGSFSVVAHYVSVTSIQIELRGFAPAVTPAAGTTQNIHWIAAV